MQLSAVRDQRSAFSDQLSVRLVVELRRPELVEGSKRGGLLTRSVFGVGAEG